MVRLTSAGRSAIEAAAPQHVTTVRHFFFDPLSDDESTPWPRCSTNSLAGMTTKD